MQTKKNRSAPPTLANRFLNWFLKARLAEEVQGDLEERYEVFLRERSVFHAKLLYWYEVFHYLRPFAIRKSNPLHYNNYAMLENYFKIGWRNMTKQKMYSSIKVGGFALGIAACLLITLFIKNELSYDKHYKKNGRIFRLVEQFTNKGVMHKSVHTPAPLASAVKEDFPEVEEVARLNPVELFGAGNNDIRRADQVENTHEGGFVHADPAFLTMLEAEFIYGNPARALSQPNTLVITRRKAEKYFPGIDPVGKLMIINNNDSIPYKIDGVIEDPAINQHFNYDFYISLSGREFYEGEQTNWLANNYPVYVLVREGTNVQELEQKLTDLVGEKYYLPRLLENGYPNAKEEIKNLKYTLQPVSNIYLDPEVTHDHLSHGDARFAYMSGAVALFILLIACVNFINLMTAKSANRAKEVGLRKVVGSVKSNLINQFLSESLLYSFLSFFIGLIIAATLLPFFHSLVGKSIPFPWTELWLLPAVLGGALVIGLIAGLYPAFYLSSFKPIDVIKGKLSRGSKNSYTRSMLVVFQFTTSIVLIIGTMVIYRQMNHILTSKVGFEKEQVLLIQGTDLLGSKTTAFKNELMELSDVQHVSVSDYLPIQGTKRNGNGFWNEGKKETDSHIGAQFWLVDHNYLQTLGIKLVQGRNFSEDMSTDSDGIIINETMARELNLEDPIGARIENYKAWTVIGVCEDFHFASLKENVRPLAMVLGNSPSIISVKFNGDDMVKVIAGISSVWKRFAPQQPIRYTFLDESFAKMYDDVQRMGRIFTSFAVLALVVACLGLFGLSSFMVEQRSKEISIRLVLGASVNNIFGLLTQNFVMLVLVSFVIAAPIAWYIMKKWLEDFVNRTELSVDIFIFAGVVAMVIAVLTISYQAVNAALTRPVEHLKGE